MRPASPTRRTPPLTFSKAPSNPHALKQPRLIIPAIRHFDALSTGKRWEEGENSADSELKAEIVFYERQLREPRDYETIRNDSIVDAEALVAEEDLSPACVELVQNLLIVLKACQ